MSVEHATETFATPLALVKVYNISLHNCSQDFKLFCFVNPGCCSDAEDLEKGDCKHIDNHKTNSALFFFTYVVLHGIYNSSNLFS